MSGSGNKNKLDRILKHNRGNRDRNSVLAQLDLLCRSKVLDIDQLTYVFEFIGRSEFRNEFPFDELYLRFELAFGLGFDAESLGKLQNQLMEYFTEPGKPIGVSFDDGCDLKFSGKTFCFTGEFAFGTRADCERATEELGGIVKDTVIQRLDCLVIGKHSSPNWKHEKFGQKIRDAVEINRKRQFERSKSRIQIISEGYWLSVIERLSKTAG